MEVLKVVFQGIIDIMKSAIFEFELQGHWFKFSLWDWFSSLLIIGIAIWILNRIWDR